jgi:hypothetical protein
MFETNQNFKSKSHEQMLSEFAHERNLTKRQALTYLIEFYELQSIDELIKQIKLKADRGLDLITLSKLQMLSSFLQAYLKR